MKAYVCIERAFSGGNAGARSCFEKGIESSKMGIAGSSYKEISEP